MNLEDFWTPDPNTRFQTKHSLSVGEVELLPTLTKQVNYRKTVVHINGWYQGAFRKLLAKVKKGEHIAFPWCCPKSIFQDRSILSVLVLEMRFLANSSFFGYQSVVHHYMDGEGNKMIGGYYLVTDLSSTEKQPEVKPDTFYRHYKGGFYHVIAVGKMEHNQKLHVVYESTKGEIWIRPLEEWNEIIQDALYPADQRRFTVLPGMNAVSFAQSDRNK